MSIQWDNNSRIDLTCPECSRKFTARLGELRGKSLICPGCGIGFDGTEFDRGLRKLDREVRGMFK